MFNSSDAIISKIICISTDNPFIKVTGCLSLCASVSLYLKISPIGPGKVYNYFGEGYFSPPKTNPPCKNSSQLKKGERVEVLFVSLSFAQVSKDPPIQVLKCS